MAIENGQAFTTNEVGNLRIVPIGRVEWGSDLVMGQENPAIQGWYSVKYNTKVPSSTAVYTASMESSDTCAWLIVSGKGPVAPCDAWMRVTQEAAEIKVDVEGAEPQTYRIPIVGKPGVVELR